MLVSVSTSFPLCWGQLCSLTPSSVCSPGRSTSPELSASTSAPKTAESRKQKFLGNTELLFFHPRHLKTGRVFTILCLPDLWKGRWPPFENTLVNGGAAQQPDLYQETRAGFWRCEHNRLHNLSTAPTDMSGLCTQAWIRLPCFSTFSYCRRYTDNSIKKDM